MFYQLVLLLLLPDKFLYILFYLSQAVDNNEKLSAKYLINFKYLNLQAE